MNNFIILVLFWELVLSYSLPISYWNSTDIIDYCPFDWFKSYELIWSPPAPTGNVNVIELPNDALPGVELSLTINGEDEKYPFHVGEGGYGGRVVNCSMPEPSFDNKVTMNKLGPICTLSDPPVMKCSVFDAWLESAPGGPLFDLLHAGADTPQANGAGERPSRMPVGDDALAEIPKLYDQFILANVKVEQAQWRIDLAKEETKESEKIAKQVVDQAKDTVWFWGEEWAKPGAKKSDGHNPKCFERLESYRNATVKAMDALKKDNKDHEASLNDELGRWKGRRNKLTKYEDGRYPGGFVEDMSLEIRDVWGRTILHWAAAKGQELLLAGGLDETAWAYNSQHGASDESWSTLVLDLLTRGAAVNICDVDGRTPLDLAVSANHPAVVKLLLDAGAGLDSVNRWGHSIIQMAKVVNAGDEVRSLLGLSPLKRRLGKQKKNVTIQKQAEEEEEKERDLLSHLAAMVE